MLLLAIKRNKNKIIHLIILSTIGFLPILWYKPGFCIASGDFSPHYFNNIETFHQDIYLWTSDNAGEASTTSTHLTFGIIWLILYNITNDTGLWQISVYVILFLIAEFSVYYLTLSLYPSSKEGALIASLFYIFNFFLMTNLLSLSLIWPYSFLPLLMLIFIKFIYKRY